MSSLWTDIPFKQPCEPIISNAGSGFQTYNMSRTMMHNDGLCPTPFEHRPSDPIAVVPIVTVRSDTLQSICYNQDEASTEEKPTHGHETTNFRLWIQRVIRRYWVLILAVFLIVVALVLGMGLGLTMGKKAHGAEVGSGISALDLGDGSSQMRVYVQNHSGELREVQDKGGVWTG